MNHQVIHALACVHYGRRVREFGFTILHGFIPTFYADVTDLFMASRRARIVNAVAGPLFHLFLGALLPVDRHHAVAGPHPGLPRRVRHPPAPVVLHQPLPVLLPGDGRLPRPGGDGSGVPTLNHDAVRFVRESLWARLRNLDSLSRRERIYVAYFALSLVSVTGIVGATVWLLVYAGES